MGIFFLKNHEWSKKEKSPKQQNKNKKEEKRENGE